MSWKFLKKITSHGKKKDIIQTGSMNIDSSINLSSLYDVKIKKIIIKSIKSNE